MGRGLGVHRTYYDGDMVDAAVSTARSDLRHNRVPWISFKLPYSWEEMRDGRGDDMDSSARSQDVAARRPRVAGLPPRARG